MLCFLVDDCDWKWLDWVSECEITVSSPTHLYMHVIIGYYKISISFAVNVCRVKPWLSDGIRLKFGSFHHGCAATAILLACFRRCLLIFRFLWSAWEFFASLGRFWICFSKYPAKSIKMLHLFLHLLTPGNLRFINAECS